MKLRYFYKVDNNKQPIPGSNIKRKSSPGKNWKEILDLCCVPTDIDCTCGPRFFVQLDAGNKPVPGTLIKRFAWPKMEQGIRYQEINWKSVCCNTITWSFSISEITGSLVITVNGGEVVNDIVGGINSNGSFKPNFGDTIVVTVENDGADPVNLINITGGHTAMVNTVPTATYSFVWNGEQTDISAVISGTLVP